VIGRLREVGLVTPPDIIMAPKSEYLLREDAEKEKGKDKKSQASMAVGSTPAAAFGLVGSCCLIFGLAFGATDSPRKLAPTIVACAGGFILLVCLVQHAMPASSRRLLRVPSKFSHRKRRQASMIATTTRAVDR
jgi:hypothetical protein